MAEGFAGQLRKKRFLQYLDAAFAAGELQFFCDLPGLKEQDAFSTYLAPLRKCEWAKRPFAGPVPVANLIRLANSRESGEASAR